MLDTAIVGGGLCGLVVCFRNRETNKMDVFFRRAKREEAPYCSMDDEQAAKMAANRPPALA